jgi:hypothetical protein
MLTLQLQIVSYDYSFTPAITSFSPMGFGGHTHDELNNLGGL